MTPEGVMDNQDYKSSSSDTPDISVILPTYNRPHLLREALASLCEQAGSSFEVIVINDAGCGVSAVMSEFSGRLDLRYVSLTQNRGLPAARNVGVGCARGRYLAYLDDDDLYLPDHLARLAERLERRPGVGLVYADVLLVKQRRAGDGYRTVARRILAHEYDRATMLRDSFITPSAMMHRRECVEQVGGFDETLRWCYEDWDFLLKVGTLYVIERVAGASVVVRLRDDGSNMSGVIKPERIKAARLLQRRHGVGEIRPKTFWDVAATLPGSMVSSGAHSP
jgi:glycosyltransferase involved in cell wall biosynthesis